MEGREKEGVRERRGAGNEGGKESEERRKTVQEKRGKWRKRKEGDREEEAERREEEDLYEQPLVLPMSSAQRTELSLLQKDVPGMCSGLHDNRRTNQLGTACTAF